MGFLDRRVIGAVAVVALVVVLVLSRGRARESDRIARATADVTPPSPAPAPLAPVTRADAAVASDAPAAKSTPPPPMVAPDPPASAARGLVVRTIDGYTLVRIGGGEPAIRPFGGPDQSPTRRVSGRVVDRSGHPVAGAVVLANDGFHIARDTLMARGGSITAEDGTFTIDTAPRGDCAVVALLGRDWSNIVRVSTRPLELVIAGHGALDARFTYNAGPERFALTFTSDDKLLSGRYDTDDDGTTTVTSLPPGSFSATAGLLQALGGGQSASQTEAVTIVDGETASLTMDFGAGATVAVTAVVPADLPRTGLTFWLFRDQAPRDVADARVRRTREHAPSMSVSAGLTGAPMQFHDVAAGTYWVCAARFDVKTFDAADGPFGCARAVVSAAADVVEVSVELTSTP